MSSSLKLTMTYEAACGRCLGRLQVEPTAGAVACPHCGATLAVPDDPTLLAGLPTLSPAEERVTEGGTSSVFDTNVLRAAEAVPATPDFTKWGAPSSSVAVPGPHAGHPGQVFAAAEHAAPPPSVGSESPSPHEKASREEDHINGVSEPKISQRGEGAERAAKSQATGGVSRGAFLALVLYASVVTAVCLGLAYLLLTNRHQLESLPDVVPPKNADGTISRVLAPPDAPLPPGHVLSLGETRRFGDLLVTPLKVIREPLGFTHYRDDETREPAGEVLKLWLKLENASNDKSFAPLDGDLLFYRAPSTSGAYVLRANNFLAPAADRSPEKLVAVYDHPPESDWNLAGQELGTVLAPGESVVTFVPTEADPPELNGPLAWRVHLRKGIADNGWGVTTLVEVAFDAGAVKES